MGLVREQICGGLTGRISSSFLGRLINTGKLFFPTHDPSVKFEG